MSSPRVVDVVLAAPGHPREADVLQLLSTASGVRVVRRCVDVSDFLAVVLAGLARAAVVDSSMHGLDLDAIGRAHAAGVRVVGLLAMHAGEEDRERVARLGFDDLVVADGDLGVIESLVQAPLRSHPVPLDASALADPNDLPFADSNVNESEEDVAGHERAGRILAVGGPLGSPGRTTIALGLAAELARLGQQTLLVDADTFGASVALRLGLLDEAPGLAAAARAANSGTLDDASFARVVRRVRPGLEVLTGVSRPSRWRELRPGALAYVWDAARRRADVTVIDIGFCIESDDALGADAGASTRAAVALSALGEADDVISVGVPDPVSVARLVPALTAVRELAPTATLHVIANRVPKRSSEARDFAEILARHGNVTVSHVVSEDAATLRAMTAEGLLPTEIRGRSVFGTDMRALARTLVREAGQARSDGQAVARASRTGSRRLARIAS